MGEEEEAALALVVDQVIGVVALGVDEAGRVASQIIQAAEGAEQANALADELERIARGLRSP